MGKVVKSPYRNKRKATQEELVGSFGLENEFDLTVFVTPGLFALKAFFQYSFIY